MYDIVCIGSTSQDVFFPMDDIDIINTPRELLSKKKMFFEFGAKYSVQDRFEAPGGCSANVSQGLARLGVSVASCGVIGDDFLGKNLLDELKEEGVETALLQSGKGFRTDLAFILVDARTGERTIFYNRDANEKLKVTKDDLNCTRHVFVSGLSGEWEENLDFIVKYCHQHVLPLILNPGQKNIHANPRAMIEALKGCTGLFVNKDEAIELVHEICENDNQRSMLNDEKYLLHTLEEQGVGFVSITDGKRGVWVGSRDHMVHAKPEVIEDVIDSTGAGDAFTSAFLAAFIKGSDLERCVQWGITNARSAIQYYGAKKGLLHEEEMQMPSSRVAVEIFN